QPCRRTPPEPPFWKNLVMSKNPIFSDADQLALLQLTTRKVMATRRAKGKAVDAGDDEAGTDAEPPLATVPEVWRLLPEGLELFDWQRECLPIWLKGGRGTVKVATGGGKTLFALA